MLSSWENVQRSIQLHTTTDRNRKCVMWNSLKMLVLIISTVRAHQNTTCIETQEEDFGVGMKFTSYHYAIIFNFISLSDECSCFN